MVGLRLNTRDQTTTKAGQATHVSRSVIDQLTSIFCTTRWDDAVCLEQGTLLR